MNTHPSPNGSSYKRAENILNATISTVSGEAASANSNNAVAGFNPAFLPQSQGNGFNPYQAAHLPPNPYVAAAQAYAKAQLALVTGTYMHPNPAAPRPNMPLLQQKEPLKRRSSSPSDQQKQGEKEKQQQQQEKKKQKQQKMSDICGTTTNDLLSNNIHATNNKSKPTLHAMRKEWNVASQENSSGTEIENSGGTEIEKRIAKVDATSANNAKVNGTSTGAFTESNAPSKTSSGDRVENMRQGNAFRTQSNGGENVRKIYRRDRQRAKSFPDKLMQAISEQTNEEIVAWLPDGKSFAIFDRQKFCMSILSQFFKESMFSSFIRKLRRWGFVRLNSSKGTDCFYHPMFFKNQNDCAFELNRKEFASRMNLTASKMNLTEALKMNLIVAEGEGPPMKDSNLVASGLQDSNFMDSHHDSGSKKSPKLRSALSKVTNEGMSLQDLPVSEGSLDWGVIAKELGLGALELVALKSHRLNVAKESMNKDSDNDNDGG